MEPFKRLTEDEADRLLAGKAPSGSDLSEVASFISDVKASYVSDVDPALEAAHVATMMEAVRTTENGEPFARAASNVIGPERQVSELPKWRRRMLGSATGALAVKVLGGAVALAASTVGLAAADLLPEEAQTPVADVVKSVTSVDLPGGTKGAKFKEPKVDDDVSKLDDEEGEVKQDDGDSIQATNHGQYVSCVAHMAQEDPSLTTPGQRGQIVSFAAGQHEAVLAKDASDQDCAAAYGAAKTAAAAAPPKNEDAQNKSQADEAAEDKKPDAAGDHPEKPEEAKDPAEQGSEGLGRGGFSGGETGNPRAGS